MSLRSRFPILNRVLQGNLFQQERNQGDEPISQMRCPALHSLQASSNHPNGNFCQPLIAGATSNSNSTSHQNGNEEIEHEHRGVWPASSTSQSESHHSISYSNQGFVEDVHFNSTRRVNLPPEPSHSR